MNINQLTRIIERGIISGGQTGVDRAALDAASSAGITTGGWCPPERAANDGEIGKKYPLTETAEERSYDASGIPRSLRTELNVRDSDATLVIVPEKSSIDPGTNLTISCAKEYNKPHLVIDPNSPDALDEIRKWITSNQIELLNIAGPAEEIFPGIYETSLKLLKKLFSTQG